MSLIRLLLVATICCAPTVILAQSPVAPDIDADGQVSAGEWLAFEWFLLEGMDIPADWDESSYPVASEVSTTDTPLSDPTVHHTVLTLPTLYAPDPQLVIQNAFIRGDVNGDGAVDISDPTVILAFLFNNGLLSDFDSSDVNDDGFINIADPVGLLNYLHSGGAAPAFPFPGTGFDITYDELDVDNYESLGALLQLRVDDLLATFPATDPVAQYYGDMDGDGFLDLALLNAASTSVDFFLSTFPGPDLLLSGAGSRASVIGLYWLPDGRATLLDSASTSLTVFAPQNLISGAADVVLTTTEAILGVDVLPEGIVAFHAGAITAFESLPGGGFSSAYIAMPIDPSTGLPEVPIAATPGLGSSWYTIHSSDTPAAAQAEPSTLRWDKLATKWFTGLDLIDETAPYPPQQCCCPDVPQGGYNVTAHKEQSTGIIVGSTGPGAADLMYAFSRIDLSADVEHASIDCDCVTVGFAQLGLFNLSYFEQCSCVSQNSAEQSAIVAASVDGRMWDTLDADLWYDGVGTGEKQIGVCHPDPIVQSTTISMTDYPLLESHNRYYTGSVDAMFATMILAKGKTTNSNCTGITHLRTHIWGHNIAWKGARAVDGAGNIIELLKCSTRKKASSTNFYVKTYVSKSLAPDCYTTDIDATEPVPTLQAAYNSSFQTTLTGACE